MNDDSDVNALANALLGKEEENKPDDKSIEESKSTKDNSENVETSEEDKQPEDENKDKSGDEDKKLDDKPADSNKSADENKLDESKDGKSDDIPTSDDKTEGEPAKEVTPLTREEVKEALREEQAEREAISSQRATFAGQVRNELKEALKLDSTFTQPTLEDGTPINSVTQLTQVINPETEEPYTRAEAAQLLLEAKQIVEENLADYEKRVDDLTDLNVNFKEEADEVDRKFGHILKAFPAEAKEWLENYQKTFTMSDDKSYVLNVPISPLEFYTPIVRPFLNAADQASQQQAEAKAAEEKAVKEAEIKAEQEDRGDLGGTAGDAKGKPDLLGDALTKYLKDN